MRCIIVEDEYPSREELKYFIKEHSHMDIVKEFEEGLEALKFLENHYVDVVFLDINMPNVDGMCLGKIINKFSHPPKIVFITAYKEYAVQAFEVNAFDYVLKPYSKERMIETLRKLENDPIKKENVYPKDKMILYKDEKMMVVDPEDIYYCEAHERETFVHTKEETYIAKVNISQFYEKLSSTRFFKSHRSFIVNLDRIEQITPWFHNTYNVKVQDLETEIPVSRNHIKAFRKIMGISS